MALWQQEEQQPYRNPEFVGHPCVICKRTTFEGGVVEPHGLFCRSCKDGYYTAQSSDKKVRPTSVTAPKVVHMRCQMCGAHSYDFELAFDQDRGCVDCFLQDGTVNVMVKHTDYKPPRRARRTRR